MYDLVIIGAGPAGLTAAYELANSNKKIIVLEKKSQVGGLAETKFLKNTDTILALIDFLQKIKKFMICF